MNREFKTSSGATCLTTEGIKAVMLSLTSVSIYYSDIYMSVCLNSTDAAEAQKWYDELKQYVPGEVATASPEPEEQTEEETPAESKEEELTVETDSTSDLEVHKSCYGSPTKGEAWYCCAGRKDGVSAEEHNGACPKNPSNLDATKRE